MASAINLNDSQECLICLDPIGQENRCSHGEHHMHYTCAADNFIKGGRTECPVKCGWHFPWAGRIKETIKQKGPELAILSALVGIESVAQLGTLLLAHARGAQQLTGPVEGILTTGAITGLVGIITGMKIFKVQALIGEELTNKIVLLKECACSPLFGLATGILAMGGSEATAIKGAEVGNAIAGSLGAAVGPLLLASTMAITVVVAGAVGIGVGVKMAARFAARGFNRT